MGKPWFRKWPEALPKKLDYGTKTLPEIVLENCEKFRDEYAVIYYGRGITFQELGSSIQSLAGWLQEKGLGKGDRVAIYSDNTPHFIISYLAILASGGVCVCLNPMFKEDELEYHLNDSGAETIIILESKYNTLQNVRNKTSIKNVIIGFFDDYIPEQPTLPVPKSIEKAKSLNHNDESFMNIINLNKKYFPVKFNFHEDIALLQYTSGTSGFPKGSMITHRNLLVNVKGAKHWWGYEKRDAHLAVLPFFHVTGMLHSMLQPVFSGGVMVLLTRFDVETVVKAIDRYQINHWSSIATMNIALVNFHDVKQYNLTSLRLVRSGGARIPVNIYKEFKSLTGVDLLESYGLSETISQVTSNPPNYPKLGSVGMPVFDVDVKIVHENNPNKELPLGEKGEIIVKGPQVMKGYWNNELETKESFSKGFFLTGDLGYMDDDGFLYISGRKKEIIKASGYSVFPAEVENYLYKHPGIAECCVFGIPDPYRGEQIMAAIVPKDEYQGKLEEGKIVEWARENMSAYKYPRIVELRESLPKNASGKILRRNLVKEYNEKT
ncbi:AMP-binding protein [Salicibibacter cibi]|uniref:AMP-binding protein n=1 Tax=Salicibibacter cibi TaxID=2743001 RepID=A0A7T6ZBD9_9BACI|nr:AMP-binding protein [Salicibibacter cibi]QQK80287.1 AMP-binding protein [Salicibibacter cibi]